MFLALKSGCIRSKADRSFQYEAGQLLQRNKSTKLVIEGVGVP